MNSILAAKLILELGYLSVFLVDGLFSDLSLDLFSDLFPAGGETMMYGRSFE